MIPSLPSPPAFLFTPLLNNPSNPIRNVRRRWEAQAFLKTQNMSYAGKNSDYDKYFRRLTDRNLLYVPTPEERAADEAAQRRAALAAAALVLAPLALVAALAAQR